MARIIFEGHVAEDGEVVGTIVEAISGAVLVDDDVEDQSGSSRTPNVSGNIAEPLGDNGALSR